MRGDYRQLDHPVLDFHRGLLSMMPMAFVTIVLLMAVVVYFYCKLVVDLEPEHQLEGKCRNWADFRKL